LFDCGNAGVFDGTAHTPVSEFKPFFSGLAIFADCERFLDVGGVTEFVKDDCDFVAVFLGQDIVQECGFACSEVA